MDKKFKVLKIDHVAVAVNSLKESKNIFTLLGMNIGHTENVSTENVDVLKIYPESDDHTIELLEPTSKNSSVQEFLNKRDQGLHHIALETPNIEGEVSRMEGCGIQFLGKIRDGSAGTKVTFIHPKSMKGVLTELCSNG